MLKTRRARVPARFSRRFTQWGLTLLVLLALCLLASTAYNLTVGEYAVSPDAQTPAHQTLVNGRQKATPAQHRSDYSHPEAG